MEKFGLCANGIMQLSGSNQTGIETEKEARLTEPSKNISIYCHFILEKGEPGEVVLQYVSSKENVADAFTKGLSGRLHNYLESLMETNSGLEDSVDKEEC